MRNYRELMRLTSFEDRYEYLRLDGRVGRETFGCDRYLNQAFYTSQEWRRLRNEIIVRDKGCDLGCFGYDIPDGVRIFIHHMDPITVEEFLEDPSRYLDPDKLITTTFATHNAIHYGDKGLLCLGPIIRRPGDTCPWK